MSSTHLALPRRSQRVGTIIPGPVISLDVWYQTVIFKVYVIYGEHWLYDITQWYQRFILWYQGLDSDICGLLVSNNDILFCLLSMISIVKKKDWYHYDIEQFKARVLHRLHRSQILSKFDLQWYHFDISD